MAGCRDCDGDGHSPAVATRPVQVYWRGKTHCDRYVSKLWSTHD
jgi:hypothetical protein